MNKLTEQALIKNIPTLCAVRRFDVVLNIAIKKVRVGVGVVTNEYQR